MFLTDYAGDIGPFQVAIVLTVVTLFIILSWRENYGETHKDENSGESVSSISASIAASVKVIARSPAMICLGLSQSFFEGATYTFVFMWVPSLMKVNGSESLTTGLVFSSFMLAMTAGGMLFGLLLPIFPGGAEGLCVFVYVVAACAMLVPVLKFEFWWVFCAFLVLEAMVGMFNSCGATLRAKYYPEGLQVRGLSLLDRIAPVGLLLVVSCLSGVCVTVYDVVVWACVRHGRMNRHNHNHNHHQLTSLSSHPFPDPPPSPPS